MFLIAHNLSINQSHNRRDIVNHRRRGIYLIVKSITIASDEAKNLYEDRAIGERKKIARNCR